MSRKVKNVAIAAWGKYTVDAPVGVTCGICEKCGKGYAMNDMRVVKGRDKDFLICYKCEGRSKPPAERIWD